MFSKLLNVSKIYKIDRLSTVPFSTIFSKVGYRGSEINKDGEPEVTKSSKFSNWTGKNAYKIGLIILGVSGLSTIGYSFLIYGPAQKDEFGNEIEDSCSHLLSIFAYPCRVFKNFKQLNQTIRDPISDKLLPDPHPLYQPMTLVIESSDVLIHAEWNYKMGWKFKKRPGLELFLDAVSPFYEVVIFTNDSAMNLHPVLNHLDPDFKKMHYRLFREATRYEGGVHIKDLSTLNRDLNKVVRVDWEKAACSMQPKNTFLMKRWRGNMDDRELIDLAAFLRMIATNNLTDVREGLSHYANFSDPLQEFRQRCEYLKTHMKKVEEDVSQRRTKSTLNDALKNLRRS